MRDQLRAIPRRGLGYGLQGAGASPPRSIGAKRKHSPEVLFNYLGQFEHALAGSDLFRLGADSAGAWHSPRALRTHTLEINCLVVGGRLEARWSYSENLHDAATVERLAARFCAALRTLLAECGEESHALSPMQQLFLTLESAQPNAGFDQWHFALRGALDVERFHRAWCAVFQRHTILRTAFVAGDEPRQIVSRHVEPPLHTEDLRALLPEARQQRLAAFLREDAESGFDLAQPPLTRLALLRFSEDEWRFVWSHHHLQIDGWSWPLLFREVGALYAGRTLPPARPYGDFIAWQQRRSATADESFWRAHLRGFARTTPLPGKGGKAVHEETRALTPELTVALGEFARGQKTTLNVLVQAAWALLLSRHSGERDVVFGASFAGRPADLPGVEGIVGPFVNNLPVRARIDAAVPLVELLRAMHSELFELNEHQFTPLAQIQSWSELPWHARLFESLLVFQNYVIGDDAFRLGDDAILADAVTPVRTNYPLTIVAEQGAQLRLTVIASAQTATEVCAQLATLLAAMPAAETLGALLYLLPARRTVALERRPSADYAPPQTATERAIAALWQEAFGLERVGVRDNFFDLGGHSLLMVRVHARLRDALKTDISIVRMFQHPTIQSLARHLDGDPRAVPMLAGVQARAEKQKAALQRQRTLARKP